MDREIEQVGEVVVAEAMNRFAVCGAEKDFCIQAVGMSSVVFGGTNRIIFNPSSRTVWRPDRGYCTSRFLEEWDANYGDS